MSELYSRFMMSLPFSFSKREWLIVGMVASSTSFIIGITTYLYAWSNKKKRLVSRFTNIAPGAVPFLGHGIEVGKSGNSEYPIYYINDVARSFRYEPHIFCGLLMDIFINIADAKRVAALILNSKDFTRHHVFDRDTIVFGGNVLFAIDGAIWSKHRKIFNPHFATSKQKSVIDIMKYFAVYFNKILDDHVATNTSFDLFFLLKSFTCDVIWMFLFGEDIGCLNGDKNGVGAFFGKINPVATQAHVIPFYNSLPFPQRIYFKYVTLDGFYGFIQKKIKAAAPESMVGQLFASGELSLTELASEVIAILFAGHDTTATTISFAIGRYLLGSPDVIENLLAETSHVPNDSSAWTADVLGGSWVSAIFKETLRLNPPGVLHPVICQRDQVVEGIQFLKGDEIMVNYGSMFRDQEAFGSDPDEFRPSRWIDGTVQRCADKLGLSVASYFVPFLNTSGHTCIGRMIAEVEGYFLLLSCTKGYKFTVQQEIKNYLGVTVSPDKVIVTV